MLWNLWYSISYYFWDKIAIHKLCSPNRVLDLIMQTNSTYKFDLILLCGVWLFFYYMFELFTDEIVLFHNRCLDADFKEHFVLFHIE